MQLNKYVYISGGLIVLALFLSLGKIISGARGYDISNDVQTVNIGENDLKVIQAEAVFDFAYPELGTSRDVNPFTLEDEVSTRELGSLPTPPPPKLNTPLPPMLPLPGEWRGAQ